MQLKNLSVFSTVGFLLTWFAVITQLVINLQSSGIAFGDTLVRFFSFFTILTNILVATFFTSLLLPQSRLNTFFNRPGNSTAIAVYITVVGIIYHLLLRNIWNPQGLQKVVDILLHTVSPLYLVLFWSLFGNKKSLAWKQIPTWLLYPICYSVLITILGAFSGYYPYPFIDVSVLGYPAALLNTLGILLFFAFVSACFVSIGKISSRK